MYKQISMIIPIRPPYLVIGIDMVPSIIGIDMVYSITDVWAYDRKFCSSSSSPSSTQTSQKPYNTVMKFCN